MKSYLFYPRMFAKLALILWISASSLVVSAQLAAPDRLGYNLDTFSDERMHLTWNDNSSPENGLLATGFDIERRRIDEDDFTYFASRNSTGSRVVTFDNEFMEPGDYYCYRVRAVHRNLATMVQIFSDYSNVICVDSRVRVPTSLRIVGYNFATSSVKLEWDPATLNSTFILERSEVDTTNFRPITPRDYRLYEFEDRGEVMRGTRYYYRVKARGQVHYSDYSNIVAFYERPILTPMQFYLQQILREGRPLVRLEWKIDLEKYTHFVIERSDLVKDKFYEVGKVSGDFQEFIDEKPFEKDVAYYRIKVMAGSEVLTTSEILDIKISQEGDEIIAYPNPFIDHFSIKLPQGIELGKAYMLDESTGKEVSFDVKLEKGLTHIYPHNTLKEGYYIVYAYSEKGEELGKFRMLKVDK